MHKSRLCALGIDCATTDLGAAAQFWSSALGLRSRLAEPAGDPRYVGLGEKREPMMTFVQRVDHESRVHLDIETDDVEREVARLEALGAKRLHEVHTWWVMEAPTGHRFCVVRVQEREGLDTGYAWNEWSDDGAR